MSQEAEAKTVVELREEVFESAKKIVHLLQLTLPENIVAAVMALECAKHTIYCIAKEGLDPEAYQEFKELASSFNAEFSEDQAVLDSLGSGSFMGPGGSA